MVIAPNGFTVSISLTGLLALAYGVQILEGTTIGGSVALALSGAASQLPTTGVALVVIAVAIVANIGLGAVAGRVLLGRPFDGVTSMLMTGLSLAVLIDCVLLMILGSVGLFIWPVILLVHAAGLAAGIGLGGALVTSWRPTSNVSPVLLLALLLPAAVWAAPILLQLASPVVPFMDVLFNHVAPVEHVREFGRFELLTTSPAPNFGPSRTLLGYVALQATIATLVDLPAALSIAAFALPLVALFAVATHRLATALFGNGAGYWSLLTVPLTFVFLRLPDARATALVFVAVAWGLVMLVDPPATTRIRQQLLIAASLGAALLIHPFIGAISWLTVGVLCVLWPVRFARLGVPAMAGAGLLALPQAAATLAVAAPSWVGVLALPLAVGGVWLVDRWNAAAVRTARLLLAAAALASLLVASDLIRFSTEALRDLAAPFPLIAMATLGAIPLARARSTGWRVIAAGLLVALLVVAVGRLLPPGSPLVQSLQGESNPKALWYWGPFMMAIAAAATLARLWSLKRWWLAGQSVVAAFVLLAILPVRLGPSTVAIDNYEEHRIAESVSIALRHAQSGYWANYPDQRNVVNASQAQLLDSLRAERERGVLTSDSHLLHVAESFRPWVATPVAVFTGIQESTASFDPERSIHAEGGRLHDIAELLPLLGQGYDYLLIEGPTLVAEWRGSAESAGYRSIFANDRGELFRHGSVEAGAPRQP
jgi:hypothetical protein